MLQGLSHGTNGINLINPNMELFTDWEDFPASIWQAGQVGWSANTFTRSVYKYKKIGSLVLLNIKIQGSSNLATTVTSVPLPFNISTNNGVLMRYESGCLITNNNVAGNGLYDMIFNGTAGIIRFFVSFDSAATWNATGIKQVTTPPYCFYFTNE